jgi:ABC-2 type transport system permease protein
MFDIFRDAYSILWADLSFLKRDWKRTVLTSLISPVLYLITFGFGLGKSVSVGGGSYLDFIIPGIIALTCMNASFSGSGMRLNVDRLFYKSFDELLMSPISLYSIVIGKALIGILRGLISSVPLIILGLILSRQFHFNWQFILALVISLIVFSLLGVMAAFISRTHQDMATFSTLVIVPMSFLCGTFFSIANMPLLVKILLYILPLTHSSTAIRMAVSEGGLSCISVLILAGFAGVFFIVSVRLIKKLSV